MNMSTTMGRYTTKEGWDAVVEGAGTRPHIDCEKINGEVYIKEVCFYA